MTTITDAAGLEALRGPCAVARLMTNGEALAVATRDVTGEWFIVGGVGVKTTEQIAVGLSLRDRPLMVLYPAEVLSPRTVFTVSEEQVEADVERLFARDPGDFNPYRGRDSFRAGYLAALAAMGIGVQS